MSDKIEVLKKPTRTYFTAIGNVEFKKEDFFPNQKGKNNPNYEYSRMVFYLNQNDQRTKINLIGGYSPNTKIYCIDKDGESMVVEFKDRGNETILEKVSTLNLFRVGVGKKEVPKTKLNEITNETEVVLKSDGTPEMISVWDYQDFLSEYDFINYLGQYLKNGQRVEIQGEITFSLYEGKLQKNFKMSKICLLKEDDKREDKFNLRVETLIDKNSLSEAEPIIQNDNTKKIKIKTNVFHQVNKNKREIIPLDIYYIYSEENEKKANTKINRLFKVSGNTIRKIGLECTLFSGKVYSQDMTDSDVKLSPELQEMIDLEVITLDEVKQSVKSFSNVKFVEEILFNSVNCIKKEDKIEMDIDDTFYNENDLKNLEIIDENKKQTNKNDNKSVTENNLLDDEEIDDDDLPF